MQEPVREQHLEHLRHAARVAEVRRDEAPRRLEVAQHRHAPAHALEVVDRPLDAGRRRDREVVEHRVGRAAGGHHERDRVLDRPPRDDVARLDVAPDRLDEHLRAVGRGVRLLEVGRGHLRAAEQADAERLERRAHRVRRVHAAARADGGARVALDAVVVLLAHLAGRERADRLERRDDRERLAFPVARLDRARVDVDAGHVHARHRHRAGRHVLVAAADDEHAVHALAVHAGLDRVGDHLARDERVLHPLGAHADAVGDGRHAEHLRHRAGRLERGHRAVDQRLDAGVARVHRRVAVRHADDGLVEVAVGEADGAEHRAVGRPGDAVRDEAGASVERHGVVSVSEDQGVARAAILRPRGVSGGDPASGRARRSRRLRDSRRPARAPASGSPGPRRPRRGRSRRRGTAAGARPAAASPARRRTPGPGA